MNNPARHDIKNSLLLWGQMTHRIWWKCFSIYSISSRKIQKQRKAREWGRMKFGCLRTWWYIRKDALVVKSSTALIIWTINYYTSDHSTIVLIMECNWKHFWKGIILKVMEDIYRWPQWNLIIISSNQSNALIILEKLIVYGN
jgi:hypothetical protein